MAFVLLVHQMLALHLLVRDLHTTNRHVIEKIFSEENLVVFRLVSCPIRAKFHTTLTGVHP